MDRRGNQEGTFKQNCSGRNYTCIYCQLSWLQTVQSKSFWIVVRMRYPLFDHILFTNERANEATLLTLTFLRV